MAIVTVASCGFGALAVAHAAIDEQADIEVAAGETIVVATKPLVPFVNGDDADNLGGFSIDLWNEIARVNGWTTEWRYQDTVGEILEATQNGEVDAAIAGISMTAEREQVLDFSYPMFNSGLQVLTGKNESSALVEMLRDLLPLFLTIVAAVAIIAFVAGHIMWLFNRRDPDWPPGYLRGAGHGMWMAASTLLANDPGTPRRLFGRLVSLLWVLVGILFVAAFTANLSSDQTVASIEGRISGIDDLAGRPVATVANTTASRDLDARGIRYVAVDKIEDAYPMLWDKRVEAIVYDAPVLLYHAATVGSGREQVVGAIFKPESYGIALPTGSANREAINDALLTLQSDGTYQRLYERYFSS